jgi:hypothetical protein
MCDFASTTSHPHGHSAGEPPRYGYMVDTPESHALIDETRRSTATLPDTAARVEALKPAFSALLAVDGWLPDAHGAPDLTGGMAGGVRPSAMRSFSRSAC